MSIRQRSTDDAFILRGGLDLSKDPFTLAILLLFSVRFSSFDRCERAISYKSSEV